MIHGSSYGQSCGYIGAAKVQSILRRRSWFDESPREGYPFSWITLHHNPELKLQIIILSFDVRNLAFGLDS